MLENTTFTGTIFFCLFCSVVVVVVILKLVFPSEPNFEIRRESIGLKETVFVSYVTNPSQHKLSFVVHDYN